MPDITCCTNDTCLLRFSCYRFMAKWTPDWQAIQRFEPNPLKEGKITCDHFEELQEGDILRKLNTTNND